jgi:hypothetical protein
VHEWVGKKPGTSLLYGDSHYVEPNPDRRPEDSKYKVHHELPANTEFDELVVGHWLHIEAMDTTRWWMNIGGVTIWITADRDGRPRRVDVYGPGDYANPVDGCGYRLVWDADDGLDEMGMP